VFRTDVQSRFNKLSSNITAVFNLALFINGIFFCFVLKVIHYCDQCGFVSNSRYYVVRHTELHNSVSNVRKYTCGDCQSLFAHKPQHDKACKKIQELQKLNKFSKATEDPNRRYACEVCGSRFRDKDTLTLHKRAVHSGKVCFILCV
jgi:Zinc finger, C2H2 type